MTCTHEMYERDTACADGMCPLCLAAEVERLQDIIGRARDWVEIDSVADRILSEASREDASHE